MKEDRKRWRKEEGGGGEMERRRREEDGWMKIGGEGGEGREVEWRRGEGEEEGGGWVDEGR